MHSHSEHCHGGPGSLGHAHGGDAGSHPHGSHGHGAMNLPEMTVDENTPQAFRTFYALRDTLRAQKHLFMVRLGGKNTHPGQAICLWALSRNDGIAQSELADMLGIARPTVTTMLQKMERAGLIERRVDESDQRFTRIYMTDDGRALHEELEAVHTEMVETTIGALPGDDQKELERLLTLVTESIERSLA